ncbi:MAG: alpha-N-arabinofuranosidase, partial [Clostridiales bacterium]|nr:alpha-N-arabinofuranosidase [Clostridiales bacterium]
ASVDVELRGIMAKQVSGRVLTSEDIRDHNTFDEPEKVQPSAFEDFKLSEKGLSVNLPAKSVVVLAIK